METRNEQGKAQQGNPEGQAAQGEQARSQAPVIDAYTVKSPVLNFEPLHFALAARMVEIAKGSPDREVCGLVLRNNETGGMEIEQITNVAESGHEFEADERELMKLYKARFDDIVGVWHSHPGGSETPSDFDITCWMTRWRYWIIAGDMVYEWHLGPKRTLTLLDAQ